MHSAIVDGVGVIVGTRAAGDVRKYEISLEVAKQLVRRGVRVIPTVWRGVEGVEEPLAGRIRNTQIRNLTLLKKQVVKFAIGADFYGRDSLPEAIYLSQLGIWSNLELLKIWCEETVITFETDPVTGSRLSRWVTSKIAGWMSATGNSCCEAEQFIQADAASRRA